MFWRYIAPTITAVIVFVLAVQFTSVGVALFAAFIGAVVTIGTGTRAERAERANRRDRR